MAQESIQEVIYKETEKRLTIMEDPAFVFPPRAGKADVIGIVVSAAVCVVLISLCMMGVIV